MSDLPKPTPGSIVWTDLTVDDAAGVRDFYAAVVGWQAQEVPMGGYADYAMAAPGTDQPITGVCHARGPNAGLPAQWLVYVAVADLAASLQQCRDRGGDVLTPTRDMGPWGRMAVIRDPAGAVLALIQPPA